MDPPPSPTSSMIRVKRESSVFSTTSTSSRTQRADSFFIPPFSGRDRVPFTPDFDASTPRLPNVSGRSDLANHIIAEQLKTLLDTDDHPAPPPSSPSDEAKPDIPTSLPRLTGGNASRLLSEAFQREYSAAANDERKRAYSTMYTEEEEDRATRFSRAPSCAGSMASQSERSADGGRKRFRAESQPAQPLILPGLGEGRQRNINGKSLYGGQDVGVGVIGSQAFLDKVEEVGEAMKQECDIPMPAPGSDWRVRQIEGEEEGMKFMVGPHIVSLEEDLPPLAAEHPARVWNSILHSLPQELVPTVQWKYERVVTEDEEDQEPLHICQLTLSLSPTHPAIADHPAFSKLPTNRHTAEYITATAAIGGSKTWTGEAKAIKTDATNSALVKAITSGAFEWLHNTSLDDPVHSTITITRQRSESPPAPLPDLSQEPAQPSSSASNETAIEQPKQAEQADQPELPEQRWELIPFVKRACQPVDEAQAPKEATEPIRVEEIAPPTQAVDSAVEIKQTIQKMFERLPSSVNPIFQLSVKWDHDQRSFIDKLDIGTESHHQSFLVKEQAATASFGTAVLTAANQEGLEAFLKHIEDSAKSSSSSRSARGGEKDGRYGDVIEVPAMDMRDEGDMLVDWVEQLKAFCRSNNLRFPTYTQQVEKIADCEGVKFRATMKLEEDVFCAKTAYNTILQARQEIARWVFTEHFGQHAITLDYHNNDGGFKGGRGGKGGNKRGRGRW